MVFNKSSRLAALVFAALLFCLAACETEVGADGTPPPGPGAFALAQATAAVNVSGSSVRLNFDSDREGTFYALLVDAESGETPGAAEVKTKAAVSGAFAASGPMASGQNACTIDGIAAGNYTACIAAEDEAGALVPEPLVLEGITAAPFAIAGSQWYMGAGRLTFGSKGQATIHDFKYAYTYDSATRTGYVSGHVNKNSTPYDGKKSGDIINAPGSFSVNIDDGGYIGGITFANYRDTPFKMDFAATRSALPSNSLAGTSWWWLNTSLVLEFLPNGKVLQFSTTGYYPHPHIYSSYTFDPEFRYAAYPNEGPYEVGFIHKADRVCSFSTAPTALSGFVIMYDWKDDRGIKVDQVLYFPGPESRHHVREPFNKKGYKEYGHRADFARLTDD
jgi:hypothetical protein